MLETSSIYLPACQQARSQSLATSLSIKKSVTTLITNPLPRSHSNRSHTYSIKLRQISPLRKMRTQTRLRTSPSNATQSPQHARGTKHRHPHNARGHHRRQTIQDHGEIVEHVRGQPVGLAFWLEGCADAVGEEDRCDAAGRVLQDVEEEGGCGGRVCVADADSWGLLGIWVLGLEVREVWIGVFGLGGVSIPWRTAREERRPAIELQNACRESYARDWYFVRPVGM